MPLSHHKQKYNTNNRHYVTLSCFDEAMLTMVQDKLQLFLSNTSLGHEPLLKISSLYSKDFPTDPKQIPFNSNKTNSTANVIKVITPKTHNTILNL